MAVDYPMTSREDLCEMVTSGYYNICWYHKAHATVKNMAKQFSKPKQYVADVLAVTSPRVSVTRNIRATRFYFQSGVLPTDLIKTTHLALAHYEQTGEIRGPKTSRFAKALMLDEDVVVLDVWMAQALGVPQKWFGTKNGYGKGEARIRETAEYLGLPPAQTQAAIWAHAAQDRYRTVPDFVDKEKE